MAPVASSFRLAGDRRVSFVVPAVGIPWASSVAATHGATAVPSVSAIVKAPAAARVIDRLTYTSSFSWGESVGARSNLCTPAIAVP